MLGSPAVDCPFQVPTQRGDRVTCISSMVVGGEKPFAKATCEKCTLRDIPTATRPTKATAAKKIRFTHECKHRGKVVSRQPCNVGCTGLRATVVDVHICDNPETRTERCTVQYRRTDAVACVGCDAREEPTPQEMWACGVAAAPRNTAIQRKCFASLHAAGWDNILVSAEPKTPIWDQPYLEWHCSETKQFAFPNFVRLLRHLLVRRPHAKYFHLVQDDTVFALGLREYLERALWPTPRAGCVSLYTPSHYASIPAKNGWIEVTRKHAKSIWGACSLVFPREVAERLLARSRWWKRKGQIDVWVGQEIRRMGLAYCCASPSLAQHIGGDSPMRHGAATGRRRAADFVGISTDVTNTGVNGVSLLNGSGAGFPVPRVRHLILIRSAYDSSYPTQANVDRLKWTESITIPSLQAQTHTDFTVCVGIRDDDPLRNERITVWRDSGLTVRFASGALRKLPEFSERRSLTRLDDDDALHRDYLRVMRETIGTRANIAVVAFKNGLHVQRNGVLRRTKINNQFITIYDPNGGRSAFEFTHGDCAKFGRVVTADFSKPAWLWLKHANNKSHTGRLSQTSQVEPHKLIDWKEFGLSQKTIEYVFNRP
jgi:hypothetical protein